MELTGSLETLFTVTATALKGASRRVFMARTVQELGRGGPSGLYRKGRRELASGLVCVDAFHLRGRQPVEAHLLRLLDDLRAIVDGQSQTNPQFRNQLLYTPLSVDQARRQLITQKGYTSANYSKRETMRLRLNALGYYPQRVAKTRPKKIAQTDAIFEKLNVLNAQAEASESVLRVSMDAKARVSPLRQTSCRL